MTPNPENDQENIHLSLEDALQSYPVITAPAGFSNSVMNSVRSSEPKLRFRLTWIDYALTLFATSMIGLALTLLQLVPMKWIMQVRFKAFILWERSIHFQFTPILLGGCFLILIAVSFAIFLFRRPRVIIVSQ
jgi:hypothetical protein